MPNQGTQYGDLLTVERVQVSGLRDVEVVFGEIVEESSSALQSPFETRSTYRIKPKPFIALKFYHRERRPSYRLVIFVPSRKGRLMESVHGKVRIVAEIHGQEKIRELEQVFCKLEGKSLMLAEQVIAMTEMRLSYKL